MTLRVCLGLGLVVVALTLSRLLVCCVGVFRFVAVLPSLSKIFVRSLFRFIVVRDPIWRVWYLPNCCPGGCESGSDAGGQSFDTI